MSGSHLGRSSAHCSQHADHVHVVPVPPQQRIVLLLELNLIKEVGHSSVHGHGGEEVRVSRRWHSRRMFVDP